MAQVNYVHTGKEEQKVTIRTTSGNLLVNAQNDTVFHYGDTTSVEVKAIATSSYHVYGNVEGTIVVESGHVQIEKSAQVGSMILATKSEGNNAEAVPTITATKGAQVGTIVVNDNSAEVTVEEGATVATVAPGKGVKIDESKVIGIKASTKEVDTDKASVFAGGLGTEISPYLIDNVDQIFEQETDKETKINRLENTAGYYKLIKDLTVNDEIYLSGKTWVIDLNGHTVKLEYAEGVKVNNGSVFYIGGKGGRLTINDSSEDQSGTVIGSNQTYPNKVTSAVRAGNYGKLTINGGHFYGTSEGTSCIFVYTSMSSGSKATVTINGGTFETTNSSNGTYFVLNHQDNASAGCTITVNGGKFKNYNPGVTTVDPVNDNTGKIVLGEGCTTTQKEIDGVTWYTISPKNETVSK